MLRSSSTREIVGMDGPNFEIEHHDLVLKERGRIPLEPLPKVSCLLERIAGVASLWNAARLPQLNECWPGRSFHERVRQAMLWVGEDNLASLYHEKCTAEIRQALDALAAMCGFA